MVGGGIGNEFFGYGVCEVGLYEYIGLTSNLLSSDRMIFSFAFTSKVDILSNNSNTETEFQETTQVPNQSSKIAEVHASSLVSTVVQQSSSRDASPASAKCNHANLVLQHDKRCAGHGMQEWSS